MMLTLDNVISKDQWKDINNVFTSGEGKIDGKASASPGIKELKQSTIFDPNMSSKIIFTNQFKANLHNNLGVIYNASARFSEYEEGDFYHWHMDDTESKLMIAYTIFLSKPSEYEGGQLEIETEQGVQAFKLQKGSILLYPADYLHRVKPVTKGKRRVAIGWILPAISSAKDRFTLDKLIKLGEYLYKLSTTIDDEVEHQRLHKAMADINYIRTQFKLKTYNDR